MDQSKVKTPTMKNIVDGGHKVKGDAKLLKIADGGHTPKCKTTVKNIPANQLK